MEPVPRKATVLFADIAGSTALYERMGDRAALSRIVGCLDRFSTLTVAGGGRVVKTIGDELMCEFPDPASALVCATNMQLERAAANDGLGVRCGFHHGDVIERDHDVFGDTVNVAARVTALARPAQILAPKPCVEALPGYMQSGIRTLGAFGVRGKEHPLDLCEILWDISADLTVMHGGPTHSTPSAAQLMIAYRGRNWQVARDGHVTLGRAVDNDVVVDCPRASRTHARIEGRPAGFVLIDLSSNGTFVANTTGREIILRREELLLQGEGSIGPGERPGVDPQGALRFSFSN